MTTDPSIYDVPTLSEVHEALMDDIERCWACDGIGYFEDQCTCMDDTCCCLNPTPLMCHLCRGKGTLTKATGKEG